MSPEIAGDWFCFGVVAVIIGVMETKELLKRLIGAEPTADCGELAAANVLAEYFESAGLSCRVDCWDDGRANAAVHVETGGTRGGLLFAAHLDVVPPGEAKWRYPAFEATESGGRIYGRGSADMKGGLVATAAAIIDVVGSGVKLQGDIVFAAVAGEETDSCGATRFLEQYGHTLGDVAGVVIPEPTGFDVVTAHRGVLWLKVRTAGKTAHGSMPREGINAIMKMNRLIDRLTGYEMPHRPHPLLGGCSMSINRIAGGMATNVIPDECSIDIDIRTVPGQEHEGIMGDMEKVFDEIRQGDADFKAEASVIRSVEALLTNNDSEFIKSFLDVTGIDKTVAVGFTTDGPHFAHLGAPIVIFGPGDPEVCHKPDEYIDIADVEKAKEYYKDIIVKFLT